MRSLRIYLAATVLAGIGLACNTPSVPIPPPVLEALRFQPNAATPGKVVMQGAANPKHANALFYTFNETQGIGVITRAGGDGAFTTTPFDGKDGDIARIYFDDSAGERSQEACVELRLDSALVSQRCPE